MKERINEPVPFLSPRVRQMYIKNLERQRDAARRWAAAWKRAAKSNRAWRHTVAEIAAKQIVEHAHCQEERDEARAQLANAAASEVEAVQRAQECEAELREAREQQRMLAQAVMGRWDDADYETVVTLARSIVEEDAA